MQLTSLSLALTRAGLGGFSPSSLFLYGEQGVWYEPSLANGTCFQDAAGTTPVTAVEQPVGLILDKSKGLVLGPELVTNGDFSNGTTGWGVDPGWVVQNGRAEFTQIGTGNRNIYGIQPNNFAIAGRNYKIEFDVISGSGFRGYVGNTLGPVSGGAGTRYSAIITPTANGIVLVNGGNATTGAIDNISVRELPGNHAYQTTSTSRPVLSARYNLLTKTEQFDDAVWTKSNATVTANAAIAPDGTLTADKLVENTANSLHFLQLASAQSYVAGITYVRTLRIKAAERFRGLAVVDGGSTIFGSVANANFNLQTGVIVPSSGCVATLTPIEDGWYLLSMTMTAVATGTSLSLGVRIYNDSGASTYTGDGVSGFYIWGDDLRPANQADLPYQRVNTATDYDADPAKFPPYLKFDGVDDFLVTNSIDFTSTDKMTVFAGVRNLVSATGVITELSSGNSLTSGLATPGIFGVFAGPDPTYIFGLRGDNPYCRADSSSYTAPNTSVLQVSLNIGESLRTLELVPRINGVYPTSVYSGNTSAGTGNFGNYPLYIGRRGGTALPFNGYLYSLIVRGAQTSGTQVSQTETWVNQRTGAY